MIGKQSTRGFLEIRQIELQQILIPNLAKISKNKIKDIEDLFNESSGIKFDNILSQLINKPEYRLELDKRIADFLNIRVSENQLKGLYDKVQLHIKSNLI